MTDRDTGLLFATGILCLVLPALVVVTAAGAAVAHRAHSSMPRTKPITGALRGVALPCQYEMDSRYQGWDWMGNMSELQALYAASRCYETI